MPVGIAEGLVKQTLFPYNGIGKTGRETIAHRLGPGSVLGNKDRQPAWKRDVVGVKEAGSGQFLFGLPAARMLPVTAEL